MIDIEQINTQKAPQAIGPYSQALMIPSTKKLIFVSGQIPLDPVTGELVSGDIRMQTIQAIANLEAILVKAGSSLHQVVRVDLFLTNLSGDFAAVNDEYQKIFNGKKPPARQTVGVLALPKGASVELSCIAVVDEEIV